MPNEQPYSQSITIAFDLFQKYRSIIEAARCTNEDTTRLRAIDSLLVDVLGWPRDRIESEKYCREVGFADYFLSSANSFAMVVEAKRDGEYFLIPSRTFDNAAIGFGLLATESKSATNALHQAIGYASNLGARYVAITNGHQWLLALTYVEGQGMNERSVLVFESLDAIQNRFAAFYDAFSPLAVEKNLPSEKLLEQRRRHAPHKLSALVTGYPRRASRNIIANELSYVIKNVLTEVNHTETSAAFLRECYVLPSTTSESLAFAKELLEAFRSSNDEIHTDPTPSTRAVDLIRGGRAERPILVLGGVGHGKTTFLRYLREVSAREALVNYIQIDVDFLDTPERASEVAEHIYKETERQLLEYHRIDITEDRQVRGFLNSELARFANSPRGKLYDHTSSEYRIAELEFIESQTALKQQYLARVMHHLRMGQHKFVTVFLDNLDRRDEQIQEEAFLRASAIARDWKCLVFVCLRPDTFSRSKKTGVLDSLAPQTITVSAPDVSILLKKRFEFASKVAKGEQFAAATLTGKGIRETALILPTVATFLECCRASFWENKNLVAMFNAVANGNVRDLLRYVSEFLTSEHLDTRKILDRIKDGYKIPEHEALRALLFGDNWDYSPERSRFTNLLDIEFADPREHFVKPLVLQFCQAVPPASQGMGFVPMTDISQYLANLGFLARATSSAIDTLIEKDCLEGSIDIQGSGSFSSPSTRPSFVRITGLGRYHLNHLLARFQYLDAIIIDTPIVEDSVRKHTIDTTEITARIQRVERFAEYLRKSSYLIQDAAAQNFWGEVDARIRADIIEVRNRAERT